MSHHPTRNTSNSISRDARYRDIRFGNRHNSVSDCNSDKPKIAALPGHALDRLTLLLCLNSISIKNHVLCSCFPESMSALQSVLPIGVWRVQRCYYVTTTPCCCRHFHSAFLRTARQSCGQGSLAMAGKSLRMHSIASFIHSTLSITLSVQSLCCYHKGVL